MMRSRELFFHENTGSIMNRRYDPSARHLSPRANRFRVGLLAIGCSHKCTHTRKRDVKAGVDGDDGPCRCRIDDWRLATNGRRGAVG
jgi:hypothetical protein